jgi:glycosyltransferase involved in cell wall biosynthesis
LKTFAVVIPCFNEAARIDVEKIIQLLKVNEVHIIFIDDGSSDSTHLRLESEFGTFGNFEIIRLRENVGKSNALRVGMLRALDLGFDYIGTYDADGAISSIDLLTAMRICAADSNTQLVSGARILLAGSDVSRDSLRRWAGRIIATIIAIILRTQMYDPQSPCKVYRAAFLRNNLSHSFETRWFVDTEIILRSQKNSGTETKIVEFPVISWRDIGGSHLSISHVLLIAVEIIKLYSFRPKHYSFRKK